MLGLGILPTLCVVGGGTRTARRSCRIVHPGHSRTAGGRRYPVVHRNAFAMKKRDESGFTLIEAMVVVAVLGILAAISVPNYSRYVTRGHLVDAGNALSEYRNRMEQFYQDNRTYARAGMCGQAVPTNLDNFAIACAIAAGGQAFTATAIGAGSTAGFVYTINQANVRSTMAIPSHWGTLPRDAGTKWVIR